MRTENYLPAKSNVRRGRSCAGTQTMFDIFLKRLGHYLRAGTRPAPAERQFHTLK